MSTTLLDGERLYVSVLDMKLNDPERGDIVVFKYPQDTSIDYIKRIVGVPGDVLEMKDKKLYRNGQLVQEDYIQPEEGGIVWAGQSRVGGWRQGDDAGQYRHIEL